VTPALVELTAKIVHLGDDGNVNLIVRADCSARVCTSLN
jgi:hypothetical protein